MDLTEVKQRKGGDIQRHPWELARFKVVNSLLSGVITNDKNYNVLDIGCGDIFFVSGMSELYPNIKFYAIDIAFTDEIIKNLQPQVQGKNIFLFKSLDEAAGHLQGQADLVLLLDVVEHIDDDLGFLKMLFNHPSVSPKTDIMITVPAYQSLFCSHDHFLGHYRRYTNQTLLDTIKSAGFRQHRIGYFFSSLIPPRILQVLTEKIRKKDFSKGTTGLVEWNKGTFISNLMKSFLTTDFYITSFLKKTTGINLPGLSNYIICKKAA